MSQWKASFRKEKATKQALQQSKNIDEKTDVTRIWEGEMTVTCSNVVCTPMKGKKVKQFSCMKGQSQLADFAMGTTEQPSDLYKNTLQLGQQDPFPLGKGTVLDKFVKWQNPPLYRAVHTSKVTHILPSYLRLYEHARTRSRSRGQGRGRGRTLDPRGSVSYIMQYLNFIYSLYDKHYRL